MSKRQSTEQQAERLKDIADRGAELRQFVDNEVIQDFFTQTIEKATKSMVAAELGDHEARLVASATIKVTQSLKRYLEMADRAGQKAEEKYAELFTPDQELGDS